MKEKRAFDALANDIKSSFGCFERFRTAESLLVLYCLQQDVESIRMESGKSIDALFREVFKC